MRLEVSLLIDVLIALDVIADSEVGPALEAHTALGVLAHFGDIFLDVLEGRESAC